MAQGERAIQTLHVGDLVQAENPATGKVEAEAVQAVIQDPVSPLIAVDLSDGSAITRARASPAGWRRGGCGWATGCGKRTGPRRSWRGCGATWAGRWSTRSPSRATTPSSSAPRGCSCITRRTVPHGSFLRICPRLRNALWGKPSGESPAERRRRRADWAGIGALYSGI